MQTAKPTSITLHCKIRSSHGFRGKKVFVGPSTATKEIPCHISCMMAWAIHFDELITRGVYSTFKELAKVHGYSTVHLHRIMSLNLLATDIQEDLLFLTQRADGSDPVAWREILRLTQEPDWQKQRKSATARRLRLHSPT